MGTQNPYEEISEILGHCNSDILSGWETGQQGLQRIGGNLFERNPPEHLAGKRLRDWLLGYETAKKSRSHATRQTLFLGSGKEEDIVVTRKGWVSRGKVISQMEKSGARGDIDVLYMENGEIKKKVKCGI